MVVEGLNAIINRHDTGSGLFDREAVKAIVAEALGAARRDAVCAAAQAGVASAPAAAFANPGWSGFFKRPVPDRQEQLLSACGGALARDQALGVLNSGGLSVLAADAMVENCVGTVALPLGLGLNFVLNGKPVEAIPMAVEEPSVIAACSGAAKLVAAGGGFTTSTTRNVMIGQIQLIGVGGGEPLAVAAAAAAIRAAAAELVTEANTHCGSMQRRGGGVLDVVPRVIPHRYHHPSGADTVAQPQQLQLIVHVHIDVQDAMGANLINTVVEAISDSVLAVARRAAPDTTSSRSRCGLRILSNLCDQRLATARFRVPASELAYKGFSGEEVGQRIEEAWRLAVDDPYRATTHNKGIMNGVDAVAVATGQDWRALEAAAHTYAATSSSAVNPAPPVRAMEGVEYQPQYAPLSTYSWVGGGAEQQDGYLAGELTMPVAVGVVGGAVHSHPSYAMVHALLGNPSASQLAQIIVAVGAYKCHSVLYLRRTSISLSMLALCWLTR